MSEEFESIRREIIKSYGESAYYKELEDFMEQARALNMEIEISTELDMPIFAKLRFKPLLCWRENQALLEELKQKICNEVE